MIIPALFMLASPVAAIDRVIRLQGEYKACLTQQIVAVGAGNDEPAETLIRAATSICRSAEVELRAAYSDTPLGNSHVQGLMERDRKIGEDDGVAALLAARSARQNPK